MKIAVIALCAAGVLAGRAQAFQAELNAFGQGHSRASLWVFPNRPPATANFDFNNPNTPNINIAGTGIPGADPRTHVFFQALTDQLWHVQSSIEGAGGDECDWHSMLPYVTPSSADAVGSMDVSSEVNNQNSATFMVNWSGSDPGVAMHIGWFLPDGTELFETPVMIGPFSETDSYTITSPGPIMDVMMECSSAAVSIPAPGGVAVLGLVGVLAARRRR